MSHEAKKPIVLSVETASEQQAKPARCALTTVSAKKRFSNIPGVVYPSDNAPIPAPAKSKSGEPAIFEGDEWFYVESLTGKRRLWALFPVRAWAETWISEMHHPENFTVKQLINP